MGTKKILKAFLFSFLFAGILHLMSISDALGDLSSDFTPCSGKPANPMFVETQRLLLATSNNGLDFTRKNKILADRATVPDAAVLSDGRILVYYVTACKIIGGQEVKTNEIVVAVSDDSGNNWFYKNVTFKNLPSGTTNPVDPNVVLLPNGNLRMFATVDPDIEGPQKARTYSFLSTDGGFTYVSEGERFSLSNKAVLDPEIFRFSDTNWKLWAGNEHAISTDGNNFTYQGASCYVQDGSYCSIVADIVDFSTYYRMYVHGGSPTSSGNNWIKSLVSTDTTNWTLEAGNRLTVDPSTGLESETLLFPTVVGLKNGTYLMVYQTTIPYSELTLNYLTVLTKGTGSGTVTSNPAGISCGSDCFEAYTANTSVTLTAEAGANSTFAGWSGDCSSCGSSTTCSVTMDANKSCTATFTENPPPSAYTLTITKSGTGSGLVISTLAGISCGEDCTEGFSASTSVSLQATADEGAVFAGWTGDCVNCGSSTNCSITVDSAKTCGVVILSGLKEGWNLLCLVGGQEKAVGDLLANSQANFKSVWKWTKDEKGNTTWGVYLPEKSDKGVEYASTKGFVSLQSISPGEGFWVNVGSLGVGAIALGIGDLKQANNVLKIQGNGWHLVGLTGSKDKSVSEIVSGNSSKISSIWKWVQDEMTGGKWGVYLPGQPDGGKEYAQQKSFDFINTIKVGEGFWLNATGLQAGEELTIQ